MSFALRRMASPFALLPRSFISRSEAADPALRARSTSSAWDPARVATVADTALLPSVTAAVQAAGRSLRKAFSASARPAGRKEIVAATRLSDAASLAILGPALNAARPGAGWVKDEVEGGTLPPGEWWVVDPVEGNINYVHGTADWCVSATLVRDNVAVLTVVDMPMTANTYVAVRGGGAYLDGVHLRTSAKTSLADAIVGTGQAKPGEDAETYRRIGQSLTAMLRDALVVRASVPATLQLVQVAAGHMDVFWQHSQVRSGLLSGALLVEEAGGSITDIKGRPWNLTSPDFMASAPGLSVGAIKALSTVG